jgi:uncharacterized membrane protein YagU involved in acid resistance
MLRDSMQGAWAGLVATAPMTAVMEWGFEQLPRNQRYALPPREITSVVGETSAAWQGLSEPQKQAATWAAHFAYGSAMGAIYGALTPYPARNAWTGAAFGLGVWAGSYLGLLPGLGILRSATQHPPERNVLMIAAHLVWGATLGTALTLPGADVRR